MPSTEEQRRKRAEKGQKIKTGGNTRPDVAWIEAVLAAGELHEPDESTRPPGFLYEIRYQWDGYAEELNVEFFEYYRRWKDSPNLRKCNGTSYVRDETGGYIVDAGWERLRRPCLSPPSKGTVVCQSHGGKIPHVREAAQRVISEAAEVVALRLVGLTDFADEKENPIAHKDRISASNSVLDRAGVKGSMEIEVTTPGYKKVMEDMFQVDSPDGE